MDRIIGNYTSQENRTFPLDCETLEALQNNIDMLGALGNMVGDKTILSGCGVKTGGGREEGYVFLKTAAYPMGEVLHFPGSDTDSDYLHLTTVNGNVTQGTVTYTGAYTTRQVTQGGGEEQWPWAELTTPVDVEAIAVSLRNQMADILDEVAKIKPVPLGVVEMYSGAGIPEGYALCDGQALSQSLYPDLYQVIGTRFNKSGTASGMFCLPDLRGRFIVGQGSESDYNTVGNTGGEKTHKLTESELPGHTHSMEHTHNYMDIYYSEHNGAVGVPGGYGSGDSDNDNGGLEITRTTISQSTTKTGSTGGGAAHENRPPYFVLSYIMRLQ